MRAADTMPPPTVPADPSDHPEPAPGSAAAPPGPDSAGAAIAAAGIAVEVAGRLVWNGVDLAVPPGEFVAVLGPNGVGKSTLIKALLGLVGLSAGELRVLGAPPGARPGDIGYLPQRRSFDAGLRIRGIDVVRLGLDGNRWGTPLGLRWPGGRAREGQRRVDEAIGLVGAASFARRPIGEISGGEQQRLLIAQALVRQPSLLLLDQPLDSLDLANQAASFRHTSGEPAHDPGHLVPLAVAMTA